MLTSSRSNQLTTNQFISEKRSAVGQHIAEKYVHSAEKHDMSSVLCLVFTDLFSIVFFLTIGVSKQTKEHKENVSCKSKTNEFIPGQSHQTDVIGNHNLNQSEM